MIRRQGRGVASLLAIGLVLPVLACGGGRAVSSTIDDATITARVKTALLNDPQVNATKISVNTAGGVVTITGVVKSKADESRAIQLARRVGGVKDVKSTLQIGSGSDPTPILRF